MKNSIQKDNVEKTKWDLSIGAILVGIVLEIFYLPIWIILIIEVQQPGTDLIFLSITFYSVPIASGIGLILYGTIKILKKKNLLSHHSIKMLKIISNLVVYLGLALMILSLALQILYIFHINDIMVSPPLIILIIFLIFIGCCISSSDKRKNERKGEEKI